MNHRDRAQEPAMRALASAVRANTKGAPATKTRSQSKAKELSIPESYELVVTCRDENDQRQLYERLAIEGYECRVLTM